MTANLYTCKLIDGELSTELAIKISSFQMTRRLGGTTYFAVVTPEIVLSGAIATMAESGNCEIHLFWATGPYPDEYLVAVPLQTIRDDQGGRNRSISLSGYVTETPDPTNRDFEGVSYRSQTGTSLQIRCSPNQYANPGDTAWVGDDVFEIDSISWTLGESQETYEIGSA